MNNIRNWNITTVPEEEVRSRQNKILKVLNEKSLDAMVFFSGQSLRFLTGSYLRSSERPMVFIIKADGSTALIVPRLEVEHAYATTKCVDLVETFQEYPGEIHPMTVIVNVMKKLNLSGKNIAADSDGYGSFYGYRGPKLSEIFPDIKLTFMPYLVEEIMTIKSEYDQNVIRESARWANLAHALLQDYTRAGASELEVVNKTISEACNMFVKAMGVEYKPGGMGHSIIDVGYRGQIGKNSYFPHVTSTNAIFHKGEHLVSEASVTVLSYVSELERVLFIGEPTKEQEMYYNHVINMQDIAFNMIKPGRKCSDVDKEVMRYFKENDIMGYWRHHTGHALGFAPHEAPFLDSYDDTILEPGMVFSVEPGIYVKDVGGFRLSDTVLVTDDGVEMITYYQRDIEKVICKDF